MKKLTLLGLVTVLLTLSGQLFAETRYISDKVYVPLRVGDGSKYRIVHRGLPSGTKLGQKHSRRFDDTLPRS